MMESDNITQQADEIEVIASIYGDSWCFDANTSSYSINITPNIKLYITLHSEYPSHKSPDYELLAPDLSGSQKIRIAEEFKKLYNENFGSPVLYQWIERLKEIAEEENITGSNADLSDDKHDHYSPDSTKIGESSLKIPKCEIIHGPTIIDRKSVFQGHCSQIKSLEDIRNVMDSLMENKKIKQATHNISAYRIQMPNNVILQDCDDDGETHAGSRVLHLLQILDVKNVLVVITRWYGGVHIGPNRFKHINNAARRVLEQAGYIGT